MIFGFTTKRRSEPNCFLYEQQVKLERNIKECYVITLKLLKVLVE